MTRSFPPAALILAGLLDFAPGPAMAAAPQIQGLWQPVLLIGLLLSLLLLTGFFAPAWFMRRRRLYFLMDSLPGGVAVYRGRRVAPVWHSAAITRILGCPAMVPAEGIAEADRHRFLAAFGALRQTGTAFDFVLARAIDGSLVRISGRRSPAGDDLLWVAEADCSAPGESFLPLLDSLPMPLWMRRADLSVYWCNSAYARALDRSRESVLREGIELGGGVIEEEGRALARRARSLDQPQQESRHLIAAGRRILFDFTEMPLGDGRVAGYATDVTAVEAMQAEMGRHVAAQEELLERLGAAVAIYGPDARLRFFNKAFARMFGYDEAQLRSEPTMDELFDDARERRVIEDLPDFPAFKREQVRRLMGVVESLEDLLHTPSGRTIRRVAAPHPFGGVLLIFEDVTDRLALERSYNTLIEVQRDTLDHLGEGIAVFGGDGRLKLSNPAFARLWNLAPSALAGEMHLTAITERFKSLLQAEECSVLRQQMIAGMEDRRPRAGRLSRLDERTVDFVALPLPDGGVLYRFADVTDSVNVEHALVERNAALETADRLKTEFLANISYELRTPLTTIIGFSEMLDRRFFGPLNARQAEYAASIVSASRALLGLIDDILDLANIEAGYLQLEPQAVDAVALFRDLATLLLERARSRELSLVFEGASALGPFVADERRLKQALFNLISNSIKFTPAGGRITVATRRVAEAVEFSVSDTGVGIAPADQARVFEKFERAGSGRQSGAGLGLALVRNLIGLHGGSVALQSEPGKGTTVLCSLPANGPKAQQTAAA